MLFHTKKWYLYIEKELRLICAVHWVNWSHDMKADEQSFDQRRRKTPSSHTELALFRLKRKKEWIPTLEFQLKR